MAQKMRKYWIIGLLSALSLEDFDHFRSGCLRSERYHKITESKLHLKYCVYVVSV